jgi:1-acyl-sn-glycerol-3-phosphate acyltransferase
VWLLPVFSQAASLAVRGFYRFTAAGGRVPAGGPVLLVANHPNSLLDPATVVAVARRPVRFLAKAPLFTDPLVGWLIRGSGSLPVYRRQDDPAAMGQNEGTFQAVHRALAEGSAVGIFPEGTSHSEPSLVPLKTGAARMALGAAAILGHAFPVVPVGLTFREKETFRTEALALVGGAVAWDDLAGRGEDDAEAVRELTRRIDAALHEVTVNLERWEDAPLVETAEAVWAAEHGADPAPARRVERQAETAALLAAARASGGGAWEALARDVRQHARLLRVLGMQPSELHTGTGLGVAAGWTARQLAFFGLGAPLAAVGTVLFWPPYRLTGVIEARMGPTRDVRATSKLLVGLALGIAWTLLLAGAAAWRGGWVAGLAALVALPLVAVVTLHVHDRWERAVGEMRRFFLRARRRETVATLRERQRELAAQLEALREGAPA